MPHKDPEVRKAYLEANKEKIATYQKAYYEANKEKLAKSQKAYREANKEKTATYSLRRYGFPEQYITPELVEAKVFSILIKRELKKEVQL